LSKNLQLGKSQSITINSWFVVAKEREVMILNFLLWCEVY